jgi:hypothetical protein
VFRRTSLVQSSLVQSSLVQSCPVQDRSPTHTIVCSTKQHPVHTRTFDPCRPDNGYRCSCGCQTGAGQSPLLCPSATLTTERPSQLQRCCGRLAARLCWHGPCHARANTFHQIPFCRFGMLGRTHSPLPLLMYLAYAPFRFAPSSLVFLCVHRGAMCWKKSDVGGIDSKLLSGKGHVEVHGRLELTIPCVGWDGAATSNRQVSSSFGGGAAAMADVLHSLGWTGPAGRKPPPP